MEEADEFERLYELAEKWHTPDCTVDAGGGCILHSDIKEAWIAGYQVALATELGVRIHYCPTHGEWHCPFCQHHPNCLEMKPC